MILEDLGVRMETFIELQEQATAEALTIDDSATQFRNVLESHGLGKPFRLSHTLKRIEELGLQLNGHNRGPGFDTPFLRQVRRIAMNDVLRDIKHSARIPIPESYLLVGVADEGPAYEAAGYTNVYKLPQGHIFGAFGGSPL
jgi:RNA-dependent RNA polymerase